MYFCWYCTVGSVQLVMNVTAQMMNIYYLLLNVKLLEEKKSLKVKKETLLLFIIQ